MDQIQFETFAEELRKIHCSEDTILALWNDNPVSGVAVRKVSPKNINSDWEEIESPSEEHGRSARFWIHKTTNKIWIKWRGG